MTEDTPFVRKLLALADKAEAKGGRATAAWYRKQADRCRVEPAHERVVAAIGSVASQWAGLAKRGLA